MTRTERELYFAARDWADDQDVAESALGGLREQQAEGDWRDLLMQIAADRANPANRVRRANR